jgi:multiple sugar transport system ATP-binding protein
MADVELRLLSKVFGENTPAVDEISMTIPDHEMVVFVGPSGCGKTTTLRMVAGLERPSSGQIRIGGKLANNLTPMQRNIAMVFQNYALYPHMTTRQNMSFPLEAKKMSKAEKDQRISEVADLLDIGNLLDRTPRQLSGGQQQRVALGRAVVRDPSVLLMDEPLSNLDAKLRVRMRAEIKAFQRRVGVTTIYVTHDQTEAMTMGDRIAVILDGKLQQFDTPAEMYRRPANTRVAQLVGSPAMNLLDGTLQSNDGQGEVQVGGLTFPITDELFKAAGLASRSGAVTLGVRPDALGIHPEVGKAPGASYLGRVTHLSSEILGSIGVHTVETQEGARFTVEERTTAALAPDYPAGVPVDLYLRGPAVHLFEPGNGQRLD